MKALMQIVFCCLLGTTGIQAQRGGGMGRGGFGGGFHGGFGGYRGGFGGYRGGFGGYHGGYVNRGFGRGFIGHGYWGWPRWSWGGYYWPGSYYTYYPYYSYYPYYPYAYSGYAGDYSYGNAYATSPNVIVVYPQPQGAESQVHYQSSPAIREYDENGYEVTPSGSAARSGSPTYLIALKNHVIYDAVSYSVKDGTIYFVTIAKEQKSCPMIMVDRAFSAELNRERGVNFQLP